MEPKKDIKKFSVFTEKNKLNTTHYLIEIPLGDDMFEWVVNLELPSVRMNWGRFEWEPIQIKFNHPLEETDNNNIHMFNDRLINWMQRRNKVNITIIRVDSVGTFLDTWHLIGGFPSAIYFDQERELEITLHYDHCRLN